MVTYQAIMHLDGHEETLTLDLPAWKDREDIIADFEAEALDCYDLDNHPTILHLNPQPEA